jgi:hypothetical protein
MDKHDVGQCFDDAKAVDATGNPDSQAFAGKFIDQGHEPDAATIMGLGFDKVVAPDVIATRGPEPGARAVVEPKPASWPMFFGYFEPLTVPDPLHAVTTDPPASLHQQCGDPARTIASVVRSQNDKSLTSAHPHPFGRLSCIVAFRVAGQRSGKRGVRTDHTSPEYS